MRFPLSAETIRRIVKLSVEVRRVLAHPELARHLHDPQRLAALHAVGVLDTPTEEAFDRLSRLAARFTKAPVALVSLVDCDRQFFKSCIGLAEPWRTLRETPLSHSFCQHNRVAGRPLIVEDARTDAEFRDHPAIGDMQVIAYLGIPLVVGGCVIGSFCVIDRKPRRWTPDEVDVVADLAAAATTEIELRGEVAARRQTEARLSQVNDKYRKLFEQSPQCIAIINPEDLSFIDFNEATCRQLGYTRDELASLRIFDIEALESPGETIAHAQQLLRDGMGSFETVHRTKTGERRSVLVVTRVIELGGKPCFQSVWTDVSDRRRLEELRADIAHACRLSTIGELAASLAHEINQPLGAVSNYLAASLNSLKDAADPTALEYLRAAVAETIRAGDIIRHMREFVRRREPHHSSVVLNELVAEVARMVRFQAQHHATAIELDLDAGIPLIQCDRIQIMQVLVNLVRNAIEAMAQTHSPQRTIIIRTRAEERAAMASVVDTGPGLSVETTCHLFEPFFSNKPEGMGLGLAICKTIIEAHGGALWAGPNPAGGAMFSFRLPLLPLETPE